MKTVVNIKVDKDIKICAQELAADLGISLSTILNAQLRQFVRDKSISFSTIPKMTPELEKMLAGVDTDIKKKRNLSKPMSSKKDIDSYFASL